MLNRDSASSFPVSSAQHFALQRRTMVDRQIRTFDVTDQALIERMLDVPREAFLPSDLASLAYCDGQLQVAAGSSGAFRKLVAPLALARLIQSANLIPHESVLVVGDGPAYAAALVAGLAASVVALEVDPAFTEMARGACAKLGIDNVTAVTGPLASGYLQTAPYDVIFILGVVEAEPQDLCAQLSDRGRILTFRKPPGDPVGRAAKAVRISRVGDEFCARPLFDAAAPVIDAFRAKPIFVF
jgi:protein-L-isoaspartate(D-aspartate) O-methyltransferase